MSARASWNKIVNGWSIPLSSSSRESWNEACVVSDVKEMILTEANTGYSHRQRCLWAHRLHAGLGAVSVPFESHLSDKARWVVDPECGLLWAIENLGCLGDLTPPTAQVRCVAVM